MGHVLLPVRIRNKYVTRKRFNHSVNRSSCTVIDSFPTYVYIKLSVRKRRRSLDTMFLRSCIMVLCTCCYDQSRNTLNHFCKVSRLYRWLPSYKFTWHFILGLQLLSSVRQIRLYPLRVPYNNSPFLIDVILSISY